MSSHINFKINLKEKLHTSSLPFNREKCTHLGKEAKSLTTVTHCKSGPFWREALCSNSIWGSRAGGLFPAVPLARAGLQGRQGLVSSLSGTWVTSRLCSLGGFKSLCRSQQGLTLPVCVALGWQLCAQLVRDSRGTELCHCPAWAFSRFMRGFWCADRTGEVNSSHTSLCAAKPLLKYDWKY